MNVQIHPGLTGRPLAALVADFITERPENFDMGTWAWNEELLDELKQQRTDQLATHRATMGQVLLGEDGYCGTTFCVAGAARFLTGKPVFLSLSYPNNAVGVDGQSIDWVGEGAMLLDMPRDLADRIFMSTNTDNETVVGWLRAWARGASEDEMWERTDPPGYDDDDDDEEYD